MTYSGLPLFPVFLSAVRRISRLAFHKSANLLSLLYDFEVRLRPEHPPGSVALDESLAALALAVALQAAAAALIPGAAG